MSRDYDRHLARGALVNLLGLVAKLVQPLFFLLVTWFFGPEVVGLYFLAVFIVEIGASAVSAGYGDAVTLFASRVADAPEDEDLLYAVLGNGFKVTLGLSLVLVLATLGGAGLLVEHAYAGRPGLHGALLVLAAALPATAVTQIAICATKARMRMEYDAFINGVVRSFSLLGFSLLAWALEAGLMGLVVAHAASQVLVAGLAVWALNRQFDLRRVARATVRTKIDRRLLDFALPQSLNMTFNRYLTRVDVMMLGAFGFTNADLAFYGAAALITANLREVKLIFSQALAPVAVRHHARGDRDAFEEVLGRVSRWTTTIIVPLVLVVAVLRADLLRFVDRSYVGDSTFMLWLLVPPFLSCAYGLAGNSIVFTGHSRWNLFNSLLVAGLNTLFNWWLIPRWGLTGAAIATAMAATLVAGLQLVELYYLEGVRLRVRAVYKPHLGLLGGALALAVVWDPVHVLDLAQRVGLAVGLTVGYAVLMLVVRHEEVTAVPGLRRLRRAP